MRAVLKTLVELKIPVSGSFQLGLRPGKALRSKRLESITQFGKMVQYFRQGVFELGNGLEAVVENDDRTWQSGIDHIGEALFRADFRVKITAQNIPHDDPVMTLKELYLLGLQFSVGRPEQWGTHLCGAFSDIPKVGQIVDSPPVKVVKGMIADTMPRLDDLLKNLRVFPDIVADTKKGAFGIPGI